MTAEERGLHADPRWDQRKARPGTFTAAPNGLRLSGERSGAERVRCSRGLGDAGARSLTGEAHRNGEIGPRWLTAARGRLVPPTPYGLCSEV